MQVKKPTDLRPIEGRALKSLMDTLRPYLSRARVLDLYAGSGRISLACVQEGAFQVVLVEREATRIREIRNKLPKDANVELNCREVEMYLQRFQGSLFEVIFADPPFVGWESPEFLAGLFDKVAPVLEKGGQFWLRMPKRVAFSCPEGWDCWKETVIADSRHVYCEQLP